MKVKDKISDSYCKQVNDLLVSQSDSGLPGTLDQEEIDEIWKEISTEIDLGDTWRRISSDLDIVMPVETNSGLFVKSIATVLIILIGMVPVRKEILDLRINQQPLLVENNQNEQSTEVIIQNNSGGSRLREHLKDPIYITPPLKRSLDKSEDGNKADSPERNKSGLNQVTEKPVSDKAVIQAISASETAGSNMATPANPVLKEKTSILPMVFPEDEMKRIKVYKDTDFENLKTNNISSFSGNSLPSTEREKLSAGIMTLLKNTWLLNNETFDGLKAESLNSSEIVFYPDVGLSLNYSLNKTWLIQADGFLFSNTGQEYIEYLYGHYERKKITLRYSTIALSVKYKFTSIERLLPRSAINILAGGYFSILNYASEKINTDRINIRSQYEKFDYGLRLASEFEFQIFNQFSLAPGISFSLGIPNIYKGNSSMPGSLITTHNGSVDFQLTLYYHTK